MSYIKCARIAGVLGNNVNTDVIYPARYLVLFASDEVKRHLFEDIDPGLAPKLAGGGILAGENFGCRLRPGTGPYRAEICRHGTHRL